MAAEDPRWFMSLPGCLPTVHLCLGLERVGITHFAWMCSHAGKAAAGLGDRRQAAPGGGSRREGAAGKTVDGGGVA